MEKRKKKNDALKRTGNAFGIVSLCVLLLYVISFIAPFVWALITSVRDPLDYIIGGGFVPQDWGMEGVWKNNYEVVFKNFFVRVLVLDGSFRSVKLGEMAFNSIAYALGSAVFSMLACLLTAYIAAIFKFKMCDWIYAVVIIQMIIPIVGSLPSELRMAHALGLDDSIPGMWIMKTYVTGLYFLVFYGSFKLIPKDYAEAAQLDGAGNFRIMVNIMFPFVKGSIFTVTLLRFITFWNDYQTPLLYMPTHPTLAYGLYHFTRGSNNSDTPTQLAACILMAIPLFAVFVAFQKRLLGDLTIGGLK